MSITQIQTPLPFATTLQSLPIILLKNHHRPTTRISSRRLRRRHRHKNIRQLNRRILQRLNLPFQLLPTQNLLHLLLRQRLVLDQRTRQHLELLALFGEELHGALAGFFYEAPDFGLDCLLGSWGEGVVVAVEVDVAEGGGVAVLCY
jgi:hypothetical protein